jgi:hypothetical protein
MVIDKGHRVIWADFEQRIIQDAPQIELFSAGMVKIIVKRDIKERCLENR